MSNEPEGLADEARRLLDAATPGPWEAVYEACDCGDGNSCGHGSYLVGFNITHRGWATRRIGALLPLAERGISEFDAMTEADAEFIAAAPRLIAGLLAEREGLMAALAAERTRADRLVAAIEEHKAAVKCCDECAEAQTTDPEPNDNDGRLWAVARGSVGGVEGGQ